MIVPIVSILLSFSAFNAGFSAGPAVANPEAPVSYDPILADVQDRLDTVDQAGLYVLLKRLEDTPDSAEMPAPVNTSRRTLGSAAKRGTASAILLIISPPMALRDSGLFMVRVAIPSLNVSKRSLLTAYFLSIKWLSPYTTIFAAINLSLRITANLACVSY